MNFKVLFFLSCLILSSKVYSKIEVYNFQTKETVSLNEFSTSMMPEAQFVLGEYHYNVKIQKAQSLFISSMVTAHNLEGAFDVNWEFLNYTENSLIQKQFKLYVDNDITGVEFFEKFNLKKSETYLPIIEATKKLNGQFFGVNAPRSIKQQIIAGGISSVDPAYIPPNMELGSDSYLERFREAMGGHVNEEKLIAYYTAQCYTDSVMAYYINKFSKNRLTFLVVGSFHSDYGLGTVESLKKLTNNPVYSLKFVDKSDMSEQDLMDLKQESKKYGNISNFLVITE